MGFVSNNWFDGCFALNSLRSNPQVDRCSNPLPADPLSSPYSFAFDRSSGSRTLSDVSQESARPAEGREEKSGRRESGDLRFDPGFVEIQGQISGQSRPWI